jgi:nitroreductase
LISRAGFQGFVCGHELFQNRPVDDSLIKIILDAANQAPSAHNQQSWRFVVLREKKRLALASLVAARSNDFPKPSSAIHGWPPVGQRPGGDGRQHCVSSPRSEPFNIDTSGRRIFRTMEIQSSAAAVENLPLAATSPGPAVSGSASSIKDEVRSFRRD